MAGGWAAGQAPSWDERTPRQEEPPPYRRQYTDERAAPPAAQRDVRAQPAAGAPAAPRQIPAPFQLTQEEAVRLDQILNFWEQSSGKVTRFNSKFRRFKYDKESGDAKKDLLVGDPEEGRVWFESPDKATLKVEKGKPEHWICDGKAVFIYDFDRKVVAEYKIPPQLQGRGITEGPLPFVFGAKAAQLKARYWMRVIPPEPQANGGPAQAENEFLLEAYPRQFDDARNWRCAQVILRLTEARDLLLPVGVRIFEPNPNRWMAFGFYGMELNPRRPWIDIVGEDPFSPKNPGWGWKRELAPGQEETLPAARPAPGGASSMGSRQAMPR
jgi:TIGR03009 family protein